VFASTYAAEARRPPLGRVEPVETVGGLVVVAIVRLRRNGEAMIATLLAARMCDRTQQEQ
jgi:hypothetical protein